MKKKVLLLGYTGKMGLALNEIFKVDYEVIGKNTNDFDAENLDEVKIMIKGIKPDILINTVAFLGIDPCEKDPIKALKLNALYPKLLAELSNEFGFLLVHFSTDAVFNNRRDGFYVESDTPKPINVYGLTKYGGDCFIQAISEKYYIMRISLLFGESMKNNQFVEKMLQKIKEGNKVLRIADDIVSSPSYSRDVAQEVKRIIESSLSYGLYHTINEGRATLFEIFSEIVRNLDLDVKVERASYKDFPYIGIKNVNTPITSEKIKTLRHWKDAVKEYAKNVKLRYNE